jgi:hypothetical protein
MAGPRGKSTIVFRRLGPGPKAVEKLWEMPGWISEPELSDDGEYLVWCREGPSGPRRRLDEVMVSIFRKGSLVSAIRLNQIVLDPRKMGPRPTGAYPWGACKGFVGLHDYSLVTRESRRLIYDVTTGELVEAVFVDRGKPASQTTMDDLWDDPPVGRTLHRSEDNPASLEPCCGGNGGTSAAPPPALASPAPIQPPRWGRGLAPWWGR